MQIIAYSIRITESNTQTICLVYRLPLIIGMAENDINIFKNDNSNKVNMVSLGVKGNIKTKTIEQIPQRVSQVFFL